MDKLGTEELLELQEEIIKRLPEEITAVLVRLNTNGRLEEFLYLIGMKDLQGPQRYPQRWQMGVGSHGFNAWRRSRREHV